MLGLLKIQAGVLIVLTLAVLLGCHSSRPTSATSAQASSVGADSAACDVVAPSEIDILDISVVYDKRLQPKPLTETQLADIFYKAERCRPEDRAIWFVLVRNNRYYDDELHYTVNVFFTPDVSTPRLRKCRCVGFNSFWEVYMRPVLDKIEELEEAPPKPARQRPLQEYYQVSLPEKPFTTELRVPNRMLLPFQAPESFSDEEVVEIVDFVRTGDLTSTEATFWRFNQDAPIYSLKRTQEGIEVHTGTMQGPLAGTGEGVLLRRIDDGFVVLRVWVWYS